VEAPASAQPLQSDIVAGFGRRAGRQSLPRIPLASFGAFCAPFASESLPVPRGFDSSTDSSSVPSRDAVFGRRVNRFQLRSCHSRFCRHKRHRHHSGTLGVHDQTSSLDRQNPIATWIKTRLTAEHTETHGIDLRSTRNRATDEHRNTRIINSIICPGEMLAKEYTLAVSRLLFESMGGNSAGG
jgi:hypothetical protein